MNSDRIQQIFHAALQISDLQTRAAFIALECEGDQPLLHRLLDLLRAYDDTGCLLTAGSVAAAEAPDPKDSTTPSPIAMDPGIEIGVTLSGRYKLLGRIGEGGMGSVWMADQLQPVRRLVAVKLIKPGMDSGQIVARFEAERQALAVMDHPNIARVFDGGILPSGRPFFVMEYVKGIPLTRYCDEAKLSLRERLRLFIPVCQAVQHAHQKGIIHRDLKPSNILVCPYDGKPVPKVIDFGLAKAMNERLTVQTFHTAHGMIIGTPLYMSPEQAELNNLDVDTRSDVYSLGVILYELLTGTTPLEQDELRTAALNEVLRLIREVEAAKPSTRVSNGDGLPLIAAQRGLDPRQLSRAMRGDLDWIVMKTLEKERGRRYGSSVDLANDIERFLRDEPVVAGPPGISYRLQKYARRHRNALIFCLAATMFLCVMAAWIWQQSTNRHVQQQVLAQRLTSALDEASIALGRAVSSPIGQDAEWKSAEAHWQRVTDLADGVVDPLIQQRVVALQQAMQDASEDRKLAEKVEEVVIMGATHSDPGSWTQMEIDFRTLFRERGMDLDIVEPATIARQIREHRSAAQLSDALELWIGTRGQLAALGGPPLNARIMEPWAQAMYAADPDPVRTGIRRLIYSGQPPTREQAESVCVGIDLTQLTPRTLSWLGSLFLVAQAPDRGDAIFRQALRMYAGDLMLNFDYAYFLASQQRWQEAIRYYSRCLAIRNDVAGIWRGIGVALRHTNELAQSEESLRHAVQLQPDHVPVYLDLADTLIASKQFVEAISVLKSGRQLAGQNAELIKQIEEKLADCRSNLQ